MRFSCSAATALSATALLLSMASTISVDDAYAADSPVASQLRLSYDGVTWHDDLPALFEPATLVPGDVLMTTLFVRNDSEDAATLTIIAEDVALASSSPDPFYDELALVVREQGSASVEVSFSELSDAQLYGSRVDPTQVVALDIALVFPHDATSGADLRVDRASFALRVTLAHDEAIIPSEPGDQPGDPDEPLPGTGGTAAGLWWALAAITAGMTALLFDRQRATIGRGTSHGRLGKRS